MALKIASSFRGPSPQPTDASCMHHAKRGNSCHSCRGPDQIIYTHDGPHIRALRASASLRVPFPHTHLECPPIPPHPTYKPTRTRSPQAPNQRTAPKSRLIRARAANHTRTPQACTPVIRRAHRLLLLCFPFQPPLPSLWHSQHFPFPRGLRRAWRSQPQPAASPSRPCFPGLFDPSCRR